VRAALPFQLPTSSHAGFATLILFFNSTSVALERASSLNEFAHTELSKGNRILVAGQSFDVSLEHRLGDYRYDHDFDDFVTAQERWDEDSEASVCSAHLESKNRTLEAFEVRTMRINNKGSTQAN